MAGQITKSMIQGDFLFMIKKSFAILPLNSVFFCCLTVEIA